LKDLEEIQIQGFMRKRVEIMIIINYNEIRNKIMELGSRIGEEKKHDGAETI
jgi:hypothetical protein